MEQVKALEQRLQAKTKYFTIQNLPFIKNTRPRCTKEEIWNHRHTNGFLHYRYNPFGRILKKYTTTPNNYTKPPLPISFPHMLMKLR